MTMFNPFRPIRNLPVKMSQFILFISSQLASYPRNDFVRAMLRSRDIAWDTGVPMDGKG